MSIPHPAFRKRRLSGAHLNQLRDIVHEHGRTYAIRVIGTCPDTFAELTSGGTVLLRTAARVEATLDGFRGTSADEAAQ